MYRPNVQMARNFKLCVNILFKNTKWNHGLHDERTSAKSIKTIVIVQ